MQSLKHIQNQLLALQAIFEMIFRQITTPQVLFWRKATLLPISLLHLHRALKILTNTLSNSLSKYLLT